MKRSNKTRTLAVAVFALLVALMGIAALPVMAEDEPVSIPVAADATFFRTADGIEIWTVDADGYDHLSIRMSNDELDAVDDSPASTILVAQSGSVSLYKSPNGEWSVANGPDAEGKIRVVVLDEGLGYDHQYENNIYGE